jgi:hypothetical protein
MLAAELELEQPFTERLSMRMILAWLEAARRERRDEGVPITIYEGSPVGTH